MSKLILPASCRNVQLTAKERTCVYLSTLTGRILGFGHESMKPLYTEGWIQTVLHHAHEIDQWAEKFRKQEEEDRQEADFKKTEREAPARNAIRQALIARRNHVDGPNRAYIDANLRLMDAREERMRNRKQQAYLLCERYEADTPMEDIALDSPAFAAKG